MQTKINRSKKGRRKQEDETTGYAQKALARDPKKQTATTAEGHQKHQRSTRRPGVMGAVDELLRHRDMWDPDRPLPSGPKHRITVYADGITHDSDFIPYSSKSTLLAALRQGKTPAEMPA
eukprot:g59479.t1